MRPIDADVLKERAIRVVTTKEPHTYFKAVGTHEIDKAPTIEQPAWTSVDERLPTEGVSIEMFFPITQTICLGFYKEIERIPFWCVNFPDGTGWVADVKPTHWKYRYITEAPQLPKGE